MARRQDLVYWQNHLDACKQSELTQKDYCAQHGLSTKSFYRWLRKEKDAATTAKSSLTLVPVSVVCAATTGSLIRLHSPGGWRIELPVGSAPWLADVLRQLP